MASADQAPLLGADMRAVRRDLVGAGDDRVLQVLRYVDALAHRGPADALLAPLRERLRQLRPPRPLRYARVLFVPLDSILVDAGAWRPGAPQLPRSCVAPFAGLVRRALPTETAAVDAILASSDQPERERIATAGDLLWLSAATVLRAAAMPPDWSAAGISRSVFLPLANAAATCLSAAGALNQLSDPSIPAYEVDRALEVLLRQAESGGAVAWGTLLALVLRRFPQSEAARTVGQKPIDPAFAAAAAAAMESGWTWISSGIAEAGLTDPELATTDVRRRIQLLEALGSAPAQHRRATKVRAQLRQACAQQLEIGLREQLTAPLQAMTSEDAQDDLVVQTLEAAVSGLRQLEAEARRLGGAAEQDALLRQAAAAVHARADLLPMDRRRLIELLLGSEAARSM